MKLYIIKVKNGWVVKMKCFGLSVMKEPYDPGTYVFSSLKEVFKFIQSNEEILSD